MPKRLMLDAEVSCEYFDDEALLVHLSTGELYQLNGTAARIVSLLEHRKTMEALLDALASEYEGSQRELLHEVETFVNECIKQKLLVEVSP